MLYASSLLYIEYCKTLKRFGEDVNSWLLEHAEEELPVMR
jgi:hypothetical protein